MQFPEVGGYASVVMELSLDKVLDYAIPDALRSSIKKGCYVEVPLRGQPRRGYVVDVKATSEIKKVYPIAQLLGQSELITEDLFELALWLARYYATPLRQVFRIMLPSSVRENIQPKQQAFVVAAKSKEQLTSLCAELRRSHPAQATVLDVVLQTPKGVLLTQLLEKGKISRSPVDTLIKKGVLGIEQVRADGLPSFQAEYFRTKPKALTEEQAAALHKIDGALTTQRFETHLLFGITGSGKTEVYLQAIEKALALGKSTIMLVPEISLTAQTIERFRSRFEGKIAVLHHRLSDGERYAEWHKIRSGEAPIIIGARSAIFCPAKNLGLIIVDEEHEHTYKQSDEAPCYHARDVAVMRGRMTQSCVVLGSATPSLESYYNATQGKYQLSTLTKRAESSTLPRIRIIDMKTEFERQKGFTAFSDALLDALKERIKHREQAILFLNRRGYHTTQLCQQCSHVIGCPHCDVSLTFHLSDNHLACHLCGYTLSPPPVECPECHSYQTLKYRGIGTEMVERALHAILPEVRTLRMDGDTTRHKGSHERLLRDFRTGKADVLIGTQMVAKGLHFPSVTLVGILNSDASLNIPDFRSSENVFQLITQVSGRAGRGALQGEVIIQTCLPENGTIQMAASQDFLQFYTDEIEVRRLFTYPPFTHLAKFTFTGKIVGATEEAAHLFHQHLVQRLPATYQLHPVIPAGYAKIKDKFRFQFLIRGPSILFLNQIIEELRHQIPLAKEVYLSIDIDPTTTFF